MRKKLMMVDRISSGTYSLRIFIIDGQKIPTVASNRQNATSCTIPLKVMPVRSAQPCISAPQRIALDDCNCC